MKDLSGITASRVLSGLLLFCLTAFGNAIAQNDSPDLTASVSGEFPVGDFAGQDVMEGNAGSGFSCAVDFGVSQRNGIRMAAGSGYYWFGQNASIPGLDLSYSMIPITGSVAYGPDLGLLNPFLKIGGGAAYTRVHLSSDSETETASQIAFNLGFGAGAVYRLSATRSFVLEVLWQQVMIKDKKYGFDQFFDLEPRFNANFVSVAIGYRFDL